MDDPADPDHVDQNTAEMREILAAAAPPKRLPDSPSANPVRFPIW